MNTYRIVKINAFPELKVGETRNNQINFSLPGFLEETKTEIKFVNGDYHGFEFYEIEHEIMFKEAGTAYGFYEEKPITLEFAGFKKSFTVRFYYKKDDNYGLFSQSSYIIKDLLRTFKNNPSLKVKTEELVLDLNKANPYVREFRGVWFKGVSTRVSSSALFGADLSNEPLFEQLQSEGADLSSIIIPFQGLYIQLNKEASVSSHHKIDSIPSELNIVESLKTKLIDKII